MTSKRWIVRAERVGHGEIFAAFLLGPFRFKPWARVVAWLETCEGNGWTQSCVIIDTSLANHVGSESDHPPWPSLLQSQTCAG